MATEMVKEFFYAVSYSAAMNLHIKVLFGGNSHHVAEAMFKSFAKALDAATQYGFPGSQTCFLPREASDTEGDHL